MKVRIDRDEWWPVYGIEDISVKWGHEVEISEELVKRHHACLVEFEAVQNELIKLYEK